MYDLRIRNPAALLAWGVAATLAGSAMAGGSAAPGGATAGATAPAAAEVSIPFVDHRNIRDWQADKRDGLWIQDQRRNWYYARLMSPCIGLDFALSIGFDTGRGSGQLDKFSSIIVPREGRCQITSLTRSDAPPPSGRKKKHKVVEEKHTPQN
ncbi:MAG: DUF6491 family protein [Steroidobacteraceae bacterium]